MFVLLFRVPLGWRRFGSTACGPFDGIGLISFRFSSVRFGSVRFSIFVRFDYRVFARFDSVLDYARGSVLVSMYFF